ncbi:MAG: hypothetical protein WCK03_02590 [Candidatus Taylorbacteria bacterium]
MIELTTSAVFLMSSLYGNGRIDNSKVIIPDEQVVEEMTVEPSSAITNNVKTMEAYLRKEFADTPILVDIARCESSFRQYDKAGNLVRGRVNNADVGVMQINETYHDKTAVKLGLDLHTLEGNVAYAKHLYNEQGAQPWVSSSPCWLGKQVASNI